MRSSRLISAHWWYFFNYKVFHPTPWPSRKYQGLLSFLEVLPLIVYIRLFSEEDPKLSENLMSTSAQSSGFLLFNILEFLRSCRLFAELVQLIAWRCFCGILTPWYPYLTGAPKLLERLICDCDRFPGEYYLWLLFLSFCDKEGFSGMSSLLSKGISSVAVFYYYLDEDIIK